MTPPRENTLGGEASLFAGYPAVRLPCFGLRRALPLWARGSAGAGVGSC
jgi:hypothetical protein